MRNASKAMACRAPVLRDHVFRLPNSQVVAAKAEFGGRHHTLHLHRGTLQACHKLIDTAFELRQWRVFRAKPQWSLNERVCVECASNALKSIPNGSAQTLLYSQRRSTGNGDSDPKRLQKLPTERRGASVQF